MNLISFLSLEKDEANCLCFQTAQSDMESIYEQTESICEIKNYEYLDLLLVKKITAKQKNKKRSLRNQKRASHQNFVKNSHSEILTKQQFNLNPQCQQMKKQQASKSNMDFPTIANLNINAYLPIVQINAVYKSQCEPPNLKNQFSQTLNKSQYEELVEMEFRKDLHLFCLSMEKNTQNSKQNKNCHHKNQDKGKINQKYKIQEKNLKETLLLYAKQIESEKENTESAFSEIIGRGFQGLTSYDFQETIFDERKTDREKTMITRQSQIEISQIKTFTERASSFTMLRINNRTSMLFGSSLQKQGSRGLSKHLLSFKEQTKCFPE